jgi:hypothetical protein
MKDWKTTVPGALAGVAITAKTIWPEYAGLCDVATSLFVGLLGFFAAQINKD